MKEAKEFILQKLNDCVLVRHEDCPQSLFCVWDKQAIREKKLCRLIGKEEMEFKPGKNSIFLFELNYKHHHFYYDIKVNSFIKNKYSLNEQEIKDIIRDILIKRNWDNLNVYIKRIKAGMLYYDANSTYDINKWNVVFKAHISVRYYNGLNLVKTI